MYSIITHKNAKKKALLNLKIDITDVLIHKITVSAIYPEMTINKASDFEKLRNDKG